MGEKEQNGWIKRVSTATVSATKTVFRWIKRGLFGVKSERKEEEYAAVSPSKRILTTLLHSKKAMESFLVWIGLFLFVWIAPVFFPLDITATDPLSQNLPPVYTLRSVPSGLKGHIRCIDGFSGFTIGMSDTGKVYVWGGAKDGVSRLNMKKLPQEIQKEGVEMAAAGKDHALALTKSGKLVGWGDKSCGQYGTEYVLNALSMPTELAEGLSAAEVSQIACGYQASALVKIDGQVYVWGNLNATRNLGEFQNQRSGQKIVFTNSAAVLLRKDGSIFTGETERFTSAVSSINGVQKSFDAYMVGRNAVDIAANGKCIAVLTERGELVVSGVFENAENVLPTLQDGEYFLSIEGGARHFVGITNKGRAYAWGDSTYGQCEIDGAEADAVFAGSLQTYAVKNGKLVASVGLKGYCMGTDGRGRDVFTRIVHGGKMTMTIGAVAVAVSTVIAIFVGCVAGYFGGIIDTLLMRLTEIFASIPFLPFAMLLSQIIKNYNVTENTRIFIIMLILGALSWPSLARMIRGQVLVEREKEFVTAARAMGVKDRKIAFRHIFPNVVSVTLVSVTLGFAGCLLTESSLSYLGFGVQQPQPTWGNMLNGANNSTVIRYYWWQWLFPALFLSVATICINMLGDALRDALDPKHSER